MSALQLVNLPWQHEGNVRTRYYEGKIMSRCFPMEKLADARGGVLCVLGDVEVLLLGEVKDYVLEKREEFIKRLRNVLRRLFGASDTASGSHGITYSESISEGVLACYSDAFTLESEDLDAWHLYTVRVGDNVNHGIVAYGSEDGVAIQRGYVSLNIVPRYNFQAWANATIKSYERFSKADGFDVMKRVVAGAEAAFLKSRAVRADFMIFENRVLPAGTRFFGKLQLDQQKRPLRGVLQTHIDLCAGHPVLYAPMLVPIRGDSRPWAQTDLKADWWPAIGLVGDTTSGHARYSTIFTTRPKEGENVMMEDSEGFITRDIDTGHQRADSFKPGNELSLKVLKKMLPDLRLLRDVEDIDDATFKQEHIKMITPVYRDATGAEEPRKDMKQDEAAAYLRAQEHTYKGKRNLIALPELVGNTLALYSYIAGEAMAEYQSWNESEFLDMLDVAFATWAPAKDASATDAVNAFCDALGCPKVSKAKYEFTTSPVFVAY